MRKEKEDFHTDRFIMQHEDSNDPPRWPRLTIFFSILILSFSHFAKHENNTEQIYWFFFLPLTGMAFFLHSVFHISQRLNAFLFRNSPISMLLFLPYIHLYGYMMIWLRCNLCLFVLHLIKQIYIFISSSFSLVYYFFCIFLCHSKT